MLHLFFYIGMSNFGAEAEGSYILMTLMVWEFFWNR